MKKILSIIMIIVLSTILGLAYNASTNLSLRLLEATDDVRPFREDFNYNFELVDDIFDDVTLTEFSYLDGVTSAIQTQLNAIIAGDVDTSGTPVDNDYAKFTDANTIEGRSYSEVKEDLNLEIGTDVQAYDAGLLSIAGLTTAANDMIYTTALDTYAIMDTFSELQAIVADKTLINEEDAIILDQNLAFEGTANDYETTFTITDPTADRAITFQDAAGIVVTDVTACTNIEGTLLSISTGTLNAAIPEDHITATMLIDDNSPADEDLYCYESTGPTGHWYSRAEVGIGVATSITDGLIVEADLDADAVAVGDILTYDDGGVDFLWKTPSELITAGTAIAWTGTTLNVTLRTEAEVKDWAGDMFTGNTETLITATYQVSDDTVDLVVDSAAVTDDDTTHVPTCDGVFEFCETTQDYMQDLVDDAAPELGGTLDHNNERATEVNTVEFNGLYANGNSGATPTVDWQNGNYQSITISENALLTFSNVFIGTITLVMTYTTGDYTLGFDAGYTIHEEGGTEISFTETDGAIDILKVMYLGSANNFVVGAMLDVKD